MKTLHISAECYPAAKAGGLGDVVGALPKYLSASNWESAVIIPKYHTKWILEQSFESVFKGELAIHDQTYSFSIEKLKADKLGFAFYVVSIPGKFDRAGVYADPNGGFYSDEIERYLSFQQAVLHWVLSLKKKPAILHCHDHHTGLIPFFIKHSAPFQSLANIPTVFTIHNGEYQGAYSWDYVHLLPFFDGRKNGLLDWDNAINPVASGIKNTWKLTTVSENYLEEIKLKSGLEWLLNNEAKKSKGIINGIDTKVWDPKTDAYLPFTLKGSVANFKKENKSALLKRFPIDPKLPVFTFIGRLVREKGADILPEAIGRFLAKGYRANFIVLGTGEKSLHQQFESMEQSFKPYFNAALEYNEGLAHSLYAGSDFLLMPSRVEPCGLNQMYAMRYGTVPIVRTVGGLKDSVPDIKEKNGCGITFSNLNSEEVIEALIRAHDIYQNVSSFKKLREKIMKVDFSWDRSAKTYIKMYKELVKLSKN